MEERISPYPNFSQSIGIMLIVIAGMIFLSPIIFFKDTIGHELSLLLYYLLAIGIPLWIVFSIRKGKTGENTFNFRVQTWKILPLLFLSVIGIQYSLTIPLSSLIPMPEGIKELFSRSFGNPKNIFSFCTIVILAPILEELIFRGIILNGFLKRYSPLKSIILSSILFGIVHLNPWQFVSAFLVGILIGWVYYHTKSVLYAIIIHAINNLMAIIPEILGIYKIEDYNTFSDVFGGTLNYALVIVSASITVILSIFLINKTLKKFTLREIKPLE